MVITRRFLKNYTRKKSLKLWELQPINPIYPGPKGRVGQEALVGRPW